MDGNKCNGMVTSAVQCVVVLRCFEHRINIGMSHLGACTNVQCVLVLPCFWATDKHRSITFGCMHHNVQCVVVLRCFGHRISIGVSHLGACTTMCYVCWGVAVCEALDKHRGATLGCMHDTVQCIVVLRWHRINIRVSHAPQCALPCGTVVFMGTG